MSTSLNEGVVPPLTLGWRLRMARETTGMGLKEFAAHIGVSPDTCTSAEHDKRKTRSITVNAYAMATGVSREWLLSGKAVPTPPNDGDPTGDTSDALAQLAASKRGGSRHRTTERYSLLPAAA